MDNYGVARELAKKLELELVGHAGLHPHQRIVITDSQIIVESDNLGLPRRYK